VNRFVRIEAPVLLVVAVVFFGIWHFGARLHEARVLDVSLIAYGVSGLLVSVVVLTVFVKWYVPFGRMPSQIPMWNEQYHDRARRLRAALREAPVGALVVGAISFALIFVLAPTSEAQVTALRQGGTVVRIGNGWKRCVRNIELLNAEERFSFCACRSGHQCLRGTRDARVGDTIDLAVSGNWAGTSLVGVMVRVRRGQPARPFTDPVDRGSDR
jgi:hypothetical protein